MRISRSTGFISGLLLLALGIWGGLVPFIGPYFHYAFGTTSHWHYTTNRLILDILPGALVAFGGALLITTGHRINGVVASSMAIIGGLWFAVGPAFSRIWEHGPGPIGGPLYGSTRQAIELVGYFYGLGALTVALAAFALGRFVTRPAVASAKPEATAIPQPEATAQQPTVAVMKPEAVTAPPALVIAQPAVAIPVPDASGAQPDANAKAARAPRARRPRSPRSTIAKSRRATPKEHPSGASSTSEGAAPTSEASPHRRRASKRGPGPSSDS